MTTKEQYNIPSETTLMRIAENERAKYLRTVFQRMGGAIGEWIEAAIVAPIRKRNREAAEYRELMTLGDEVYRDLGVTRGHLAYTVRNGREIARGPANRNEPAKKDHEAA